MLSLTLPHLYMKILLTRPISTGGGVGYYYDKIEKYFQYDVKYIFIGKRSVNETSFQALVRYVKDFLYYVKEIICGNYSLIHLNPSLQFKAVIRDGFFLLIAKLFRKKTVVFFRGWDEKFELNIKHRYLNIFRFVYFSADAIIVLASQFKNSLVEMGYQKPIYVETTLVSDEIFKINNNYNYDNDIPNSLNILFLSRMEKYKGIYEAINAYSMLKKKYSSLTMTLAGDGSEFNAVKEYIKSNNILDIKNLGWVDGEKKYKVYKKADIYLFPTQHGEGMPNSLLEAMAYGLPVITCPVGGVKDFFQNGKMGYITENVEPKFLAELCEILIKDNKKRADIKKFNRDYAYKHFTASNVCKRLEAIYHEIVK